MYVKYYKFYNQECTQCLSNLVLMSCCKRSFMFGDCRPPHNVQQSSECCNLNQPLPHNYDQLWTQVKVRCIKTTIVAAVMESWLWLCLNESLVFCYVTILMRNVCLLFRKRTTSPTQRTRQRTMLLIRRVPTSTTFSTCLCGRWRTRSEMRCWKCVTKRLRSFASCGWKALRTCGKKTSTSSSPSWRYEITVILLAWLLRNNCAGKFGFACDVFCDCCILGTSTAVCSLDDYCWVYS